MAGSSTSTKSSGLLPVAAAAGLPLACYAATASANGYWLDGGELSAAAVELGIAHPPGTPLAALVGHALTWVPIGSLDFRVALASAVMAAVAAAFLFKAVEHTLVAVGLTSVRLRVPLALAATWTTACAQGWWFQAVRPEVYALSAALVCIVLERLLALEARWPTPDLRPLYVAAVALGLALANHHFLALLVLPAAAPTLARVFRARGMKPLLISAGGVTTGLLTYLYLPVRAAVDPPLNLGSPTTVSRLWWVVSAEAFQKNTGGGVPQPMGERFADVGVQLVDSMSWPIVVLAAAGIYVSLRSSGGRRVGVLWLLLLIVHVAARAWLGFVRGNPDALGYLMPAFGALAALAAIFAGAALRTLAGPMARPRTATVFLAACLCIASLLQVPAGARGASLEGFAATDAFDEGLRREVPPRAVILAHNPQTAFRFWGGEASERLRPDVTLVPVPFIPYPGMVDKLVAEEPELTQVLRGYLLEGELRQPDIQSLAGERPLLVEMDVRVPPALYETLMPRGLYHEVLADGATDTDEQEGAEDQRAAMERLTRLLGRDRREPETRAQLLWRHYVQALYYAGFGDRESARASVDAGLELNPQAVELRAMHRALADEEATGPMDVAPFLPASE